MNTQNKKISKLANATIPSMKAVVINETEQNQTENADIQNETEQIQNETEQIQTENAENQTEYVDIQIPTDLTFNSSYIPVHEQTATLPSTYQHFLTYVDDNAKTADLKSTRHWYCSCGEYFQNLTNLKNHIIDKNGA